jgi:hypothetical protein
MLRHVGDTRNNAAVYFSPCHVLGDQALGTYVWEDAGG